jgi:hypothetical protein
MRTTRLALLAAAALLVPLAASAADLPVSYLVEEKPLKAAIAGTSLSFELYSDNTCTALVQSVSVLVENVTILSKLKQMTPKGDTKLPNTVELRTTLAGVSVTGNVYLRVNGTGVAPVGGVCQAQAGQVSTAAVSLTKESGTLTHGGSAPMWWIEQPLPSAPGINGFFPTTAHAASTMSQLNPASRYTCDISFVPGITVSDNYWGAALVAYDLDGCTAQPQTCTDNIKNQDESDIDCGGNTCLTCGQYKICNVPSDCASAVCHPWFVGAGARCVPAHCDNGVQDGSETAIDCQNMCAGASDYCGLCPSGQPCTSNCACISNNCSAGVCQP